MTPRKKWDRKRNLVIAMASVTGASSRFLGDVFDLPRSRISAILEELRGEAGGELTQQWVAVEVANIKRKPRGPNPKVARPFLRAELDRMRGEVGEQDLDKDLAKLKKWPD